MILELLSDLETLLGSNKDFLLGSWLKQARDAASSEEVMLKMSHRVSSSRTVTLVSHMC